MQNSYYGGNMFPEPPNGPTVSAPPYRAPSAKMSGKTVALIVSLVLLAVILFTAFIGVITYIAVNTTLEKAMQREEYPMAEDYLLSYLRNRGELKKDTRITLNSFSTGIKSGQKHGGKYSTYGFVVDGSFYEITCHYDENKGWYVCRNCSEMENG